MFGGLWLPRGLVVALLASCAIPARSAVIYSESFDAGSAGQSLSSPQFGFQVVLGGHIRLGPAQHGWSGLSAIGNQGDNGMINFMQKPLALPEHGIIKFSADLYARDWQVVIMLTRGFWPNTGYIQRELTWAGRGYTSWQTDNIPEPRSVWEFPVGMHQVPIRGALYWNQDTGENWTVITDGTQTLSSFHTIYPGAVAMDSIGLFIDRRFGGSQGDIDNLRVETGTAIAVPADAVETIRGDYFQGDLNSISADDDERYWTFNDVEGLDAVVEFSGHSQVLEPDGMGFTVMASVGRYGIAQEVRMFNNSTGQWVTLDGRIASGADQLVTSYIDAHPGNFVGISGLLRAQIAWQPINDEDPSQDGWLHGVNLARWTVNDF